MTVKILTEPHLRFLSLKGGCIDWSESTLVKMQHCWKSRVMAHLPFEVTTGSALEEIVPCLETSVPWPAQ